MSRTMSAALGLLLALMTASPSFAEFILQFGQAGVVGDNAFAGTAGDTIVTQIYLTQTGGETRLSSSSTALAIADFHVTINGTSVTPVATTIGPGFVDDGNTRITSSDARIAEFEAGRSGHVGVTTAADGVIDDSVLLGTVSFLILPGAGGIYNLTAARDTSHGAFSLANSDPQDVPLPIAVAAAAGTLEVTSTPEPSSLALAAIGAGAVMCRARWRTRKRARPTLSR